MNVITPADAFFLGFDISTDPFPTFRHWLKNFPIYKCEKTTFWYVCSYALVSEILVHKNVSSDRIAVMHNNLSAEQKKLYAPLLDSLSRWVLYIDPPKHKEIRAVFNQGFSRRTIYALRESVRDIANGLLDSLDPEKPWDMIQEFAYPLPVIVISQLLGVPREDRVMLKKWSDKIANFVGMKSSASEVGAAANQSLIEISAYIKGVIEAQRRSPRDNLLQKMIELADAGGIFTEADLIANAVTIIFTGHETTSNMIANSFFELFNHPEQLEYLLSHIDDEDAVNRCVEECLRFDSPIQFICRVASGDIHVGNQHIEKGDAIVLVLATANRDSAVFDKPDAFDITRSTSPHMGLGWGAHSCSGAALARMEVAYALQTILKRFPQLKLDPDSQLEWHKDLGLRAMKRLMVVASPESRCMFTNQLDKDVAAC